MAGTLFFLLKRCKLHVKMLSKFLHTNRNDVFTKYLGPFLNFEILIEGIIKSKTLFSKS